MEEVRLYAVPGPAKEDEDYKIEMEKREQAALEERLRKERQEKDGGSVPNPTARADC